MEADDTSKTVESSCYENVSAVNSLMLEYYKKFGKKRNLEKYFSLSTAQCEIQDPGSVFWRKMKESTDSDSGEKKSESSTELCRISIKCSVPESTCSNSQMQHNKNKDIFSPPIINEEIEVRHSDYESDAHSQISMEETLDTSMNKAHSPTSSITSQRKLEWDSLADVGYANESDKKTSASSLSTLERMALQQQYCISDSQKSNLGLPTAHSTPVEPNESKPVEKRKIVKKTTRIIQKDVDFVELSIPQAHDNPINLNLTKHISLNVEKNGGINVDDLRKNISVTPKKVSVDTEMTQEIKVDKEMQTTLPNQDKSTDNIELLQKLQKSNRTHPVLISLNSLRRRNIRKVRRVKRKPKNKTTSKVDRQNVLHEHKEGQISEAESFEYMPGHVYNQNHINNRSLSTKRDNKSSLESSTGYTTESSKDKNSFTKDLEKSINLLQIALRKRHADDELKQRLIKEIVQRLIKSKYNDDDSTDFLSGLSLDSKKLDLGGNHTTSSTSDTSKKKMPSKSILRQDKFNSHIIPSTSQSVPNLASVKTENPLHSHLTKPIHSQTDSDISIKEKTHSYPKTSSEELYHKYIDALKREQAYKKHLKEKELFLKQKLVGSDTKINIINQYDTQCQNRVKDLMKDLIRNNYDDGSGDASRLEGGPHTNLDVYVPIGHQRNHSVFTLSSGTSETHAKNVKLKGRPLNDASENATCSKNEKHYCCCPYHSHGKVGVTDSSVQVNIQCCDKKICIKKETNKDNGKCKISSNSKTVTEKNTQESNNRQGICSDDVVGKKYNICLCSDAKLIHTKYIANNSCGTEPSCSKELPEASSRDKKPKCPCGLLEIKEASSTKSSQTNLNLDKLLSRHCGRPNSSSTKEKIDNESCKMAKPTKIIQEGVRWTQTEISIDPELSDPSLSDINVISDKSCAKLVSEQYKETSQATQSCGNSGTETESICNSKSSIETSDKNKPPKRNCGNPIQQNDKEVQSTGDKCHNIGSQVDIPSSSNFTIPIQGTNMMLTVCLGTEKSEEIVENNNNNCCNVPIVINESKQTATCKPSTADNATSITEECSKGIQATDLNIFDKYNQNQCTQSGCIASVANKNEYQISSALSKQPQTSCSQTINSQESCCPGRLPPKTDQKCPVLPNSETSNCYNHNRNTQSGCSDRVFPSVSSNKQMTSCSQNPINSQESCCSDRIPPKSDLKTDFLPNDQYYSQQPINQVGCGGRIPPQIETPHCCVQQSRNTQFDRWDNISPHNDDNTLCDRQKVTECGLRYNTYPKSDCRKPLLRSNTDTERLERASRVTFNQFIDDLSKSKHDTKCKDVATEIDTGCSKSEKSSSSDCHGSNRPTDYETHSKSSKSMSDCCMNNAEDPLIKIIQDITKKYSKKDIEKSKRKKCFKEIMTILNYLLDTEESTDERKVYSTCEDVDSEKCASDKPKMRDKCIQLCQNRPRSQRDTEVSDLLSSDLPSTSTDSAACKVLNKIKKECEKYHQRKCKSHANRKCEASSSTSGNCNKCNHTHCYCKSKCKNYKTKSIEKNSVAYNLIIQTSDSVASEENLCASVCDKRRHLKNIVVKVPSKRRCENVPFKEMSCKIESNMCNSPRIGRCRRSRSLPNDSDISSTDELLRKAQAYSVREYLELNRPDFVKKSSNRQNCLKILNESRTNARAAKRELLSMQMRGEPALSALSDSDLREMAEAFSKEMRTKREPPKFISEKEMKRHSEKIYKSLPEVVRKKEERKKESIRKTNLLMANIFKRNLQKKTLQGAINLSNYSTVIKI